MTIPPFFGIRNVRLNPLRIFSVALFLSAPFLSWITVSAFGLTAQSSLLDVTISRTALSIPETLPLVSLLSMILVMLGGLVVLRSATLGLPIATGGMALFWFDSHSLYGSQASVIPVVVAPGMGMIVTLAAIGVGAASFRFKPQNLSVLIRGVPTKEGLAGIGLFVAGLSLTLDGFSHASVGELSEFTGTTIMEATSHAGFFASIFLLVFLFAVRRQFSSPIMSSVIIVSAFAFVMLDAAYHISTGTVAEFLGHGITEVTLHLSAYYGTALVVIGRIKA